MAKNYAGLGISFFPVDNGAQKAIKEMTKGLRETSVELDAVGSKGEKAFDGLKKSLDSLQKGFGQSIENMSQHIKGLNHNINLSDSLDSQYTSAAKSAGQLAAQTGVSSQKLREMTGVAIALNIPVDDLQKGLVNLETSGMAVQNLGFKNMAELAKFSDVVGSSVDAQTASMHNLSKSYGFTDEQIRKLYDRQAALGAVTGVTGVAFQNMGSILEGADKYFSRFNIEADPGLVTEYVDQVNLLAGAARQAGGALDGVGAFSSGFAETLGDVRVQMRQLATGASQELPDLMQNLGLGTGDFAQAQKALEKGPMDFVEFMGERFSTFSDEQKKYFATWSGEKLGPQMSFLIGNYTKIAGTMNEGKAALEGAEGAASRLAKSFSDGRTAAERYELSNQLFENRLFGMAKQSGTVSTVLKAQRMQHKLIGDLLESQVKKGGPIGAMTQVWITYQKMGLVPAVAAMFNLKEQIPGVGYVLGVFNDEINQTRDSFMDLIGGKISFTDFLSQMKEQVKSSGPKIKEIFGQVGSSVQEGFKEIFPDTSKMLGGLGERLKGLGGKASIVGGAVTVGRAAMMSGPLAPYVAAVGGIGLIQSRWEGGIAGFSKSAVDTFKKHFPKIAESIQNELPKFARALGDAIPGVLTQYANLVDFMADYVGSLDWDKIGLQVGDLLGDALRGIIDLGSDVMVGIFNMMTGEAQKSESTTGGKILNALVKMWKGVFNALGSIMAGMVKGLLASMSEPIVTWMMENEKAFINFQEYVFGSLFKVYDKVMDWSAKVSATMSGIWDSFVSAGQSALAIIGATFKLFRAVVMYKFIAPIIRSVEDMAVNLFSVVKQAVSILPASALPEPLKSARASIIKMNPEDFRVTTKMGLDEASQQAAYAKIHADLAGAKGSASDGGVSGAPWSVTMNKHLEEMIEELKKSNSPERKPLRPREVAP